MVKGLRGGVFAPNPEKTHVTLNVALKTDGPNIWAVLVMGPILTIVTPGLQFLYLPLELPLCSVHCRGKQAVQNEEQKITLERIVFET